MIVAVVVVEVVVVAVLANIDGYPEVNDLIMVGAETDYVHLLVYAEVMGQNYYHY